MNVRECRVGKGLVLGVTGARPGIVFKPDQGHAVADLRVSGVDWGFCRTMGFPEVSGQVLLNLFTGGFSTAQAQDTVQVTGVTGTGAGSLNVTYTRQASLLNGMPQWANGTALIYWEQVWNFSLGGVVQFTATDRRAAMPWNSDFWNIASAATGTPVIAVQNDGTVATGAGSGDFEGEDLPTAGVVKALELVCTAGSVAVQWPSGMAVLAAGDVPLRLPGGVAESYLGEDLAVTGLTNGAAASLMVVGVAEE